MPNLIPGTLIFRLLLAPDDRLGVRVGRNRARVLLDGERVQLFDLNGRLISDSGRLNDRRTQLNVATVPDGIYMAKVIAEKGVVAKKVKIIH